MTSSQEERLTTALRTYDVALLLAEQAFAALDTAHRACTAATRQEAIAVAHGVGMEAGALAVCARALLALAQARVAQIETAETAQQAGHALLAVALDCAAPEVALGSGAPLTPASGEIFAEPVVER